MAIDQVELGFDRVAQLPAPTADIEDFHRVGLGARGPARAGVKPLGPLGGKGVHQFEGDSLILASEDFLHQGLDEDPGGDPALEGPATGHQSGGVPLIDGDIEGQGILTTLGRGPGEEDEPRQRGLAGVFGALGRGSLGIAGADVEAEACVSSFPGFAQRDDQVVPYLARIPEGHGVGQGPMVAPGELGSGRKEGL